MNHSDKIQPELGINEYDSFLSGVLLAALLKDWGCRKQNVDNRENRTLIGNGIELCKIYIPDQAEK